MEFLDLGAPFRASNRGADELFVPYAADHPNAVGHGIAAQAIADYLGHPETAGGSEPAPGPCRRAAAG